MTPRRASTASPVLASHRTTFLVDLLLHIGHESLSDGDMLDKEARGDFAEAGSA